MKTTQAVVALSVAALCVTACGDDDNEQSGGANTSVEQTADKVYELTAHTRNDTSCDTDGESVLDMTEERYFAPEVESFFGFPVATIASCESPQQCRERRAEDNEDFPEWNVLIEEMSWFFSRTPPFDRTPGSPCSGNVTTSSLSTEDGGETVRIETRTYFADGLIVDKEGFCDLTPFERGFDDYMCVSIEVYTGSYVEDL